MSFEEEHGFAKTKSMKKHEMAKRMKKFDKNFGINPKNGEWEYMGKKYVHSDYKGKKGKQSLNSTGKNEGESMMIDRKTGNQRA